MKEFDFKNHPVVDAYCLLLFHRYKASGDIAHLDRYNKQINNRIQIMEDQRSEVHVEVIKILKKEGFTLKQANKLLESRAEYFINLKQRALRSGENYCGLCRCVVKTKKWDEHQKNVLHTFLTPQVSFIHKSNFLIGLELRKENALETLEKDLKTLGMIL